MPAVEVPAVPVGPGVPVAARGRERGATPAAGVALGTRAAVGPRGTVVLVVAAAAARTVTCPGAGGRRAVRRDVEPIVVRASGPVPDATARDATGRDGTVPDESAPGGPVRGVTVPRATALRVTVRPARARHVSG